MFMLESQEISMAFDRCFAFAYGKEVELFLETGARLGVKIAPRSGPF